jgi:hypothetical protein
MSKVMENPHALMPATVSVERETVSIVSYNVLLPNSTDGWWVYKYYATGTEESVTAWPHRQALLREQL